MPQLRKLPQGTYFTLKPIENPKENQVYVKCGYDWSEKKFWAQKFSDISDGRYIRGDKEVYTGFTF